MGMTASEHDFPLPDKSPCAGVAFCNTAQRSHTACTQTEGQHLGAQQCGCIAQVKSQLVWSP